MEINATTDRSDAEAEAIILFDGVCNLCSSSVDFVIHRDPSGTFQFASLQSEVGQRLVAEFQADVSQTASIVLIREGRAFTESSAVLRIAAKLRWPWPILYGFIVVPRFIRDAAYRFVARHRYAWFGKRANCRVPSLEERGRFLG